MTATDPKQPYDFFVSSMKIAAKILALLLLIALAFVINAYASAHFAAYAFPRVQPRPYAEMISAAIVDSLAAAIVISYPLVRLFPKRFWLAALAVAVPNTELRGRDLLHYVGKDEPRIIVMSVIELIVYPAAILACTWLTSQWLRA